MSVISGPTHCVLQDDDFQQMSGAWTNADKMAQIPNMDIIYGASLLTIIAACGTDSNAGLPGVHNSLERTKQVAGKLGDQIFVSIAGGPMDDFWPSKWAERAWTFQEFLLSKRHLIFLPKQVVYHCSTLSWCEDHSLELVKDSQTVGAVPVWTGSYKLRPLQLPIRSKWSKDLFFAALFINDYFSSWLKDFLKRRLTVPSDILFAFDGALSKSSRHLGLFHHGLPVNCFCESLHWLVGINSMYMGGGKRPHKGLTQRRDGFLSWSWSGWIWDVAEFEEFHTNYQTQTPEHWCRVGIWAVKSSASNVPEFWQINPPDNKRWRRLGFFPSGVFRINEGDGLEDSIDIVRHYSIPSNCIILKTVTANIVLSSVRQSDWTPALQAYSCLDFSPDNLVGGINFPEKWMDKVSHSLQVIITGNYFYGPDPRWPDRTDELDPSFDVMIVQSMGDGTLERLTTFVTRFSYVKRLKWTPITAILR